MQTLHSLHRPPTPFPAKVTYKNSGKNASKTYKCTVTVKNPGVRLVENPAVVVNEKTNVVTKVWPKSATVEYKSSDETIATVDANGEVTGVKAGKATITATMTCGTKVVTKTTEVTVTSVLLESVKQTKAAELEAVILGNAKDVKPSDITVTNTATNVVYPVKSVTVDSKDSTKVTLALFSGLTDGKEYKVALDKVEKTFVATDGKVAAVTVNKLTIPYATETTIKLVATDANGIVLDEPEYGSQDSSKYDFIITTTSGYTNGGKLYLNKVGDTAIAEVTYKTGKYGEDGKPVGNIGPNKITITAVDQSAVNNFDVRIGKNEDGRYDKAKDNKTIAVGETTNNVAYFKIKDADGNEITRYTDYTVESSDTSVLMVQGTNLGSAIKLVAGKAGTAYLLIKKDNVIVSSLAINVVAERAVTTMTVDKTSVTMSNEVAVDKKVKVTASFKDQYGNDISVESGVEVTCLSTTAQGLSVANVNSGKAADGSTPATYYTIDCTTGKAVVEFRGNGILKGSYQYKIAYKNILGQEVCARVITVLIQEPSANGQVSFALNMGETEVDAGVNQYYTADKTFAISVAELLNNVEKVSALAVTDKLDDQYKNDASKATTVKSIAYKVTMGGKTYFETDVTTTGAIKANGSNQLTVNVQETKDGIIERLPAGTYNVTATIVTYVGTDAAQKNTTKTVSGAFTVKDSTAQVSGVSVEKDKVGGTNAKDLVEKAIKFSYGDTTYGVDGNATSGFVVSVEGTTNDDDPSFIATAGKVNEDNCSTNITANSILNVTKIVVKVAIVTQGASTVYVTQEIPVSFLVTAE